MSRRIPLPLRLSAISLLAVGSPLRANDPPTLTPPPGSHVIYQDTGNGKKTPIFVKDQFDPLRHAGNIGLDPLDHQKVFSETNPESNKTFKPGNVDGTNKSADIGAHDSFATKVYDSTAPSSVYNLGSKSTYHTSSFDGTKSAAGYNQAYPTKDASPELGQATAAFAPMGSSEQNRTAPIEARTYDTYAAPQANKKFIGPEEDARHKHLTQLSNGQTLVEDIPDRPLTVDEVRDLINHGFKPNLSAPAPPESRPLNDPNYQPEPLRIQPPDDGPQVAPSASAHKVQDDDANDPVPSPGTMAEHPEDAQPLPAK